MPEVASNTDGRDVCCQNKPGVLALPGSVQLGLKATN